MPMHPFKYSKLPNAKVEHIMAKTENIKNVFLTNSQLDFSSLFIVLIF